jgi:hypothetical protein
MSPPHFLGIGAHKSGTTWLYENLKRHPRVWLPPVKEIHFFDGIPGLPKIAQRLNQAVKDAITAGRVENSEMLDYLRRYVLDQPKDVAWYRSLFQAAGDRMTGDITPAYAALPEPVVSKIRALLPDCRIIYIMRNPIDRAWSHFRFNAGTYRVDVVDYGFEDFRRHVDSPASESRTAYMRTIETWERYYPSDRMLYLFFDDLQSDPDGLLRTVCGFLDLPFEGAYFTGTRDIVVRQSIDLEFPQPLRAYLARKYHHEIAALSKRFGGHAQRWLIECEEVIRNCA